MSLSLVVKIGSNRLFWYAASNTPFYLIMAHLMTLSVANKIQVVRDWKGRGSSLI